MGVHNLVTRLVLHADNQACKDQSMVFFVNMFLLSPKRIARKKKRERVGCCWGLPLGDGSMGAYYVACCCCLHHLLYVLLIVAKIRKIKARLRPRLPATFAAIQQQVVKKVGALILLPWVELFRDRRQNYQQQEKTK